MSLASEYAKRIKESPRPEFYPRGWWRPYAWINGDGTLGISHEAHKYDALPSEDALAFSDWIKRYFA